MAAESAAAGRRDGSHAGPPTWHKPLAEDRRKAKSASRGRRRRRLTRAVTWSFLLLGTTGLVCGGGLLAWSMVSVRADLWSIGLPTAILGQVILLIGLVMEVEGLWRDNHAAAAKLNDVDDTLRRIKSASLLDPAHGSVSNTFYSHLAGGASPQVLLTDLKSQIDLLADKIAESGR